MLLGIPLGALLLVLAGAAALGGSHAVLEYTNRNQFCFGCHIGMDTVVEEYRESVHFANPSGVKATCSDCHVPREFVDKMVAKVVALRDAYAKIVHDPQPEQFEQRRYKLAKTVRERMISRDSKECRNCHDAGLWQVALQSDKARQNHDADSWREKEQTCVNCHVGTAHRKPR